MPMPGTLANRLVPAGYYNCLLLCFAQNAWKAHLCFFNGILVCHAKLQKSLSTRVLVLGLKIGSCQAFFELWNFQFHLPLFGIS